MPQLNAIKAGKMKRNWFVLATRILDIFASSAVIRGQLVTIVPVTLGI